jgi:hypothetical protein
VGGAERLRVGLGVGQSHLHDRLLPGERGTQLVGGVGDELPLGQDEALEPAEQVVEGVAQLLQLVVRPRQGEAPVQTGGRDLPRSGRDRPHRAKRSPRDEPAKRQGQCCDDGQCHCAVGKKLVHLRGMLRRRQRHQFPHPGAGRGESAMATHAQSGKTEAEPGPVPGVRLDAARQPVHEGVRDRKQGRSRDDEQRSVDRGEPQPDGTPRRKPPGGEAGEPLARCHARPPIR